MFLSLSWVTGMPGMEVYEVMKEMQGHATCKS